MFDSRPFHFHVTILGKLFTHMCLCHQAVYSVNHKKVVVHYLGEVDIFVMYT